MASSKDSPKTAAPAPKASNVPATVPEPKSTGVAVYDASDYGAGFEGTSANDFLIPFVRPLQKGSPQCDPDKPGDFIEGARAGTFFNTATKTLIDGKKGFAFVPVHRTHQFFEYVPRDQGGGLVARHEPGSPEVIAAHKAAGTTFGKVPIGDGNELIESFNVFGLLVSEEDPTTGVPVVVPFSSTQIGAYKGMMTALDLIRVNVPGRGKVPLPMFATRQRITSTFKENKKGTWYLMQIRPDGDTAEAARLAPDSPLFLAAKTFRALVVAGQVRVEDEHSGASEDGGGDGAASAGPQDKSAF